MKTYFELREGLQEKKLDELSPDKMKQYRKKAAANVVKRDAQKDIATARFKRDHPHMDVDTTDHDAKTKMRKGYRKLAKAKMMDKEEGYVSAAQRKAVWANKADGGKGHPDNKRKGKK